MRGNGDVMSKDYDPTTVKEIERVKALFGLRDWEIEVQVVKDAGEHAGDTLAQPEYRRACIRLYADVIAKNKQDFPKDSIKQTLFHEFGEIVATSYLHPFEEFDPGAERDKERDSLADHIGRIALRGDGDD